MHSNYFVITNNYNYSEFFKKIDFNEENYSLVEKQGDYLL